MGSIQKFSGGFFSGRGREGWVGGYVGGSVHEGSFHGGREIAMKGAPDLPALFIGYWEVYNHFQEGFFLEGGLEEGVTLENISVEDVSLG